MKKVILSLILCLFTVGYAQSQKAAWESKNVDKWDSSDVSNILSNSAWGRSLWAGGMSNLSSSSSIQQTVGATYTLRSSLIIRLALVRKLQIEQKYDAMDDKSKAQFDNKYINILQCSPCTDYYIFSVRGDSPELRNGSMIEGRQKLIYLSNEKGEKRTLARFSPQTSTPGSEALFFFPRTDEKGKPLLSADNKKLIFNFVGPDIQRDSPMSLLTHIEINVADIVREGVVVF